MKGANALIQALEREGADVIFGYPGGAIMPVYDALIDSGIRHILTRHEQGAAFAAIGYARITGKPGVCMATSGPGATNLVTGIADAMMDSVPMVAITGQVPTGALGTDAFQEVDIFGITLPITKHSFVLRHPDAIDHTIREAFRIATTGRPGPVLIDVPKDVVNGETEPPSDLPHAAQQPGACLDGDIDRARELLQRAERPLLYVGGGIANANAVQHLRQFVERTEIPATQTLKAVGTLIDSPTHLGMLGMHGLKAANLAVQECDLLIAAGARFDDRVTGRIGSFAPDANVIHMDIDPAEIGKVRNPSVPLVGDIGRALDALGCELEIEPWRERCRTLTIEHAWDYNPPTDKIYAPGMLRDLSLAADEDVIVACDVGQHQMWVAQHYRFRHPRQHLTSGGLGSMGFGLPAAIGAQLAAPERRVICVSGDGSIMMNIQELATIGRYHLPIKIILLDNQALGMVRQWQDLFFDGRHSEIDLSDNPDFGAVAESFGIPSMRAVTRDEVPGVIDRILNDTGPLLAHIIIDKAANVWPLVPPGASNTDMIEGAHR